MNDDLSRSILDGYQIRIDSKGIAHIERINNSETHSIDSLEMIDSFASLLANQLQQHNVQAVIYHAPDINSYGIYQSLIDKLFLQENTEIINRIYQNIAFLFSNSKPLIAILPSSCCNMSLSTAFWATERYALTTAHLKFDDTKYGILGGFGIHSKVIKSIDPAVCIPFLLQQKGYAASEASHDGIIQGTAPDLQSLLEQVYKSIAQQQHEQAYTRCNKINEDQLLYIQSLVVKQTQKAPKGLMYSYENMLFAQEHSLVQTLMQEQQLFINLWQKQETIAYLRSQYFGIREAVQKAKKIKIPEYSLQRLGVLGAGMMGAGIAYEAAKSGTTVILKDSTLANAERGKTYAVQVSNKLIQQHRMTEQQQEQLLTRIIPTGHTSDLHDVDLIIEAVYEDIELKAQVTAESINYVKGNGFFASNTTSIPITNLAQAIADPSKFIGMHFFSPVNRMPLVEIIKGKHTSNDM